MTFDPFGDFATRGYLRNHVGEQDRAIVRQLEHTAFATGLDQALEHLAKRKSITYEDVLATHRILFEPVYPWAGQDRTKTTPDLAISKGMGEDQVRFADPEDIERSVNYGLKLGQDKSVMASKPGEVMGYLAYGHPFLDGNGRTIMVMHGELAHRAGIRIDWSSTDKDAYLAALSREIEEPGKGRLDAYLKPFVGKSGPRGELPDVISGAPGLDGEDADVVLGKTDDPTLKAEYEAQKRKRDEAQS